MNHSNSDDLINSSVADSIVFLKLIESRNEDNYYYGNLPNKIAIKDYTIVDDSEYIDVHHVNFVSKDIGKSSFLKINISGLSGLFGIKDLNKTLFTKLDEYIDIDLISQFYLVRTNVIDHIDPDFFQPLKHCLKGVFFAESFLSTIPTGLFRDLELDTISIMSNTIYQTVPDFGLSDIASVKQGFTFVGNSIGNIEELKVNESIAHLKINKKIIKY